MHVVFGGLAARSIPARQLSSTPDSVRQLPCSSVAVSQDLAIVPEMPNDAGAQARPAFGRRLQRPVRLPRGRHRSCSFPFNRYYLAQNPQRKVVFNFRYFLVVPIQLHTLPSLLLFAQRKSIVDSRLHSCGQEYDKVKSSENKEPTN